MDTAQNNVGEHTHALLAHLSAGKALSFRSLPKGSAGDDTVVRSGLAAVHAVVDLDAEVGGASISGGARPDVQRIRTSVRPAFVVANTRLTHFQHAIADAEDRLAASRKRLHMPSLPSDVLGELRARECRDLYFNSDASERAALFSTMAAGGEGALLDALATAPIGSASRSQARELRRAMQEAAQPDVVALHDQADEVVSWAKAIYSQLEAALLSGAQIGVVDLRVDESAVAFNAH